jgi:Fur family ferric uptake transcriptional regulator
MLAPSRNTRQRRAIRAVLESNCHPLTVAEIHAQAVREIPKLSAVTVYRVLHAFEAEKLVDLVTIPGVTDHYELAREHHHHFYCRSCQRIFDIPCDGHHCKPPGTEIFEVEEHHVVLLGRCVDCAT